MAATFKPLYDDFGCAYYLRISRFQNALVLARHIANKSFRLHFSGHMLDYILPLSFAAMARLEFHCLFRATPVFKLAWPQNISRVISYSPCIMIYIDAGNADSRASI